MTCTCRIERTETTVTDGAGNRISESRHVEIKRFVDAACPEHGGDKMAEVPNPRSRGREGEGRMRRLAATLAFFAGCSFDVAGVPRPGDLQLPADAAEAQAPPPDAALSDAAPPLELPRDAAPPADVRPEAPAAELPPEAKPEAPGAPCSVNSDCPGGWCDVYCGGPAGGPGHCSSRSVALQAGGEPCGPSQDNRCVDGYICAADPGSGSGYACHKPCTAPGPGCTSCYAVPGCGTKVCS